jgi:hypothetical protein
MTTLIFSGGIITKRKKGQSPKAHIKDHEKICWIREYMRIDECSEAEAIQAYEKMEAAV